MTSTTKTFDAAEVLARRDLDAKDEISEAERERELAAYKLRELEEQERRLLKDQPGVLARREAARRALAQKHYLPFLVRFNPDFLTGWVHKDIARRLEKFSRDVALKRSPRLMLTMPPRHSKSTMTSKNHGAWHLGQYPNHEYMICSYSGSLSMQFSRNVRSVLRDPAYKTVFTTRLSQDSQSAEEWMTEQGGSFVSAGIGGAITGKGAHVLCIDDPVKNREDAESETARRNAIDWYTSTAYTRLAPGGGVLIILTRWHDDDLAGKLLQAMKTGGDQWELINYPAIATEDEVFRKKGEALHPERYDEIALERIKRNVGPRDWAALYQQNPVPDDGDYFKRTDIVFYDYYDPTAVPTDGMVHYAAWDFAIGQRQHNDYTVGGVCGIDRDDHLWIRDVVRGKWDSGQIIDEMFALDDRWHPERTGAEKGMIEMTLGPFLEREKARRNRWSFYYEPLKPGKQDKVARARSIQGLVQARRVHIPYNAPWSEALINEMLRFPNGINDDQVDVLSWLGHMYVTMAALQKIEKPKATWRDKIRHLAGGASDHKSAMSA